ncbi:Uma2 family endonuclease [Kitasatospora viridis]|uniref:Putative restriction endonuclease n=1 Tax=Kitasatospora viridis TaxID=281105 RepID=A0A561UJY9_9ACTN|nr:Uma2 family endonuclease [Kitasatospora viridis]TWF99679.1 putative restriction endonuclease [Kitasatospora viridis]
MDYARLRAVADELMDQYGDLAQKIEIQGGVITMMMSPSMPHELNVLRLQRQLFRQITGDLVALAGGEIEDVGLGILRRPDLIVASEAVLETFDDKADPHVLLLVAEMVSPSNHPNDYVEKMQDYPAMGIPLYLLVDPRNGTLRVSSDPSDGPDGPRYRATHDYVFGDQVKVGDWTIDSGEFKRYTPR